MPDLDLSAEATARLAQIIAQNDAAGAHPRNVGLNVLAARKRLKTRIDRRV